MTALLFFQCNSYIYLRIYFTFRRMNLKIAVALLKWLARIISLISIGIILLSLYGEKFEYQIVFASNWMLFAFFPVGVAAGLLIGWRSEGLGGSITVISLISFYIINYIFAGGFPQGWTIPLVSSPGIAFILYSIFTFNYRHRNAI